MTWGANHNASLEVLQQVQGSLKVELLMVPRSDFASCSPAETASEVHLRNVNQFSYFPVMENGRILGLYHAERWFKETPLNVPIGDDFQKLSEEIVVGADASIFDFVMQADQHPTNLVVSGNQIAGLVSLSDLQQLPVRASLFALITSLEMAMALTIETTWDQPEDWMAHLSEGRAAKIREAVAEAQKTDGFVSEIAFAQISDKADIIRKAKLLDRSAASFERAIVPIRKLRDNVAHANHYASTPKDAKNVCSVVRDIYELKAELMNVISNSKRL